MELNEAARRIFLQHWWLIAVGVIVGATIGAVITGTSNSYTAATRLVIDTQDPKARTESTAIADTVRAIATSPSLVQKALTRADASNRDAAGFSANNVAVTSLGTSGVLSLSVTDKSRTVAATVANALAHEVIQTRLAIANGQVKADQAKLTTSINTLSASIAKLDASIGSLTQQLGAASKTKATALRERLANLSTQRDFLTQQRGILQSEQASLLSTANGRPTPTIISRASATQAVPAGSSFGSSGTLGGLLGLAVALLIAAILEAVRPTLVGAEAVARELGKPHLGTVSVDTEGKLGASTGSDIAYPLKEAAGRAGVANIDLLGVGSTVDLALIAGALDSAVATPGNDTKRASGAAPSARNGREITIRPFGPREVAQGKGTGLVVIAPAVVKKTTLAEVTHFLRTTPWPLLGVMTYKSTLHWWSPITDRLSSRSSSERQPASEKTERQPAPKKTESLQVAGSKQAEVTRRQ